VQYRLFQKRVFSSIFTSLFFLQKDTRFPQLVSILGQSFFNAKKVFPSLKMQLLEAAESLCLWVFTI